MEKKSKKDDFFDQMKNYNTNRFNRFNFVMMILLLVFNAPMFILCSVFAFSANAINYASLVTLVVLLSINMLLVIIEFIFLIIKNNIDFAAGKLSSGLTSFVILMFFVFVIIFAVYYILPDERHFLIPAIIAAVATLFAAVLALMGIHYSTTKKQEERMYKNKLLFVKDKFTDEAVEYVFQRDLDCKSINVCLKNISDNFGFLCGIYRVCGREIYSIEENPPYFPIAPQRSYVIKNLNYKTDDDQLMLIYKDIEDKSYYIHLRIVSEHDFEMIKIDLCNMCFICKRLEITKRMEEKRKNNLLF